MGVRGRKVDAWETGRIYTRGRGERSYLGDWQEQEEMIIRGERFYLGRGYDGN